MLSVLRNPQNLIGTFELSVNETSTAVPPTTELLYFYDLGHFEWKVRMTAIRNSNAAASNNSVAETETPVCIAQEGLAVMILICLD